jgi:hypothetical protein
MLCYFAKSKKRSDSNAACVRWGVVAPLKFDRIVRGTLSQFNQFFIPGDWHL